MQKIQLFRPYYRTQEVLKSLKPVFDSGWTGLGYQTQLFEYECAAYLNVKYTKFLSSATAGLHLAIKLLSIEPGKKVITTPLTFVSTNHVLLYEHLKPIFCDVDMRTGCIDADKIEGLIDDEVKAIILVHYGGTPANMDKINNIARAYNIPVVEDACHAFGSSCNNVKIGDTPNICVFSFHSVKPVPICDGGLITTNNRLYNERLKCLSWLGINKSTFDRNRKAGYSWDYNVEEIGYKYHGNDTLATIGRVSLKYVDEDNARRQKIVDMYREGLKDLEWIKFVPDVNYMEQNPNLRSANHLCVIRVPRKDEFIKHMKECGIDIGCHYRPSYYYDMYQSNGEIPILKNVEQLYREMITLPLHLKLKNKDIKYIIKSIRETWNK